MTDAGGPHSRDAIDRTVETIRPGWECRTATPIDAGTDALYYLTIDTPDGTVECVLKILAAVESDAFRPEPYLLSALRERTAIPVPAVLGTIVDRDEVPSPCFLMRRRPGETPPETGVLRPEVAARVARDAGRFAGEYHAVGAFDRFGRVRLDRDVGHDRTGIEVDGRRVTTADGAGTWRGFLMEFVDWHLDRLGRFDDLEPLLRGFCDSRLEATSEVGGPALAHTDYRPSNLLLDPETAETTALLDWGETFTADPEYDLVSIEQHLSRWAPLDGHLREVVGDALRDGYRVTNRLRRRECERRRELYLAVTRLPGLVYFPAWAETVPAAERARAARTHREYVRALVS